MGQAPEPVPATVAPGAVGPSDHAVARPSLRRTLLWRLLLPLTLIVPAAVALQMRVVLGPTLEAFDQALADAVISVSTFVRDENGQTRFDMHPQAERALRTDQFESVYYAVLDAQGQLMAGDPPLAEPARTLSVDVWHFSDGEVDGSPVRVAARGVSCGLGVCQVRVGQTLNRRHQLWREALGGTLLAVLALAAAVIATVLVATRQALRPLARLGEQTASRSLDDLRPVPAGDAPQEVMPMVEAINRLLERVRQGSLAQQAFLADAAHQLRTPLAALRTETELALAQPQPPATAQTLQRVAASAARAARLSSQLLALARSDTSATAALPQEPADLKALAGEAAGEWVPRALAADVDLGFELEPAPLLGRPFLLRELLANLLHNAIEHGGRGCRVTVRTRREGGDAVLDVEDDGPGVPPADRARIFERFQRGPTAAEGSGLGLAIVRDIALGHGGSVAVLDAAAGGRGVCFQVRLPGVGG